ncbi:hypothetical protein KR074_003457 [Drosophila pseudoananassae]|nr:hypothetical protein KR074_003457 [Drosophila pseudoananassae]
MSEAVSFRDELDIQPASANDNQTTLQIDLKIEPKPEILTEAEKQDELEELQATKSEEKLQKPEQHSGDTSEGVSKETAEKQEPSRVRESDVLSESQDLGGLGDGPDLESGSSFTSCCSYKYIRKSILQRERHSSTLSINIENLVNSSLSLPLPASPTPLAEALPDSTTTSSVQLLMEQRSLSYTPECSDDFEIGIGEVYQKFASLFSRTEIDVAYSNFTQVDEDLDGYICLSELKRALEKLEIPQTHLAAKKVMAQVIGSDEDRLNFCQMLLIYGTLTHRVEVQKYSFHDKVGQRLAMTEPVDVSQVGVTGARIFFEAKIAQQQQETIVPSVFNQEQPVTRTPHVASAEIRTSSSHKEQFKCATAVFKKLESDH